MPALQSLQVEIHPLQVTQYGNFWKIVRYTPFVSVFVERHLALGNGCALPFSALKISRRCAIEIAVTFLFCCCRAVCSFRLQVLCTIAVHVHNAVCVLGICLDDLWVLANHFRFPLNWHRIVVHFKRPCCHTIRWQCSANNGCSGFFYVVSLEGLRSCFLFGCEQRDLCLKFLHLFDADARRLVAHPKFRNCTHRQV